MSDSPQWIPKVYRFPFRIRQESLDWGIPASVEAVTKYHMPDSPVTQGYVFTQLTAAHIGKEWGLKELEETFHEDDKFSWAKFKYLAASDFQQSFDKLVTSLQEYVRKDEPPIISVPIPLPNNILNARHMLTIVGYDSINLYVYNPDPSEIRYHVRLPKAKLQHRLCLKEKANDAATDVFILSREDRY
ncbi:MAG TPA: C39 family peptidase [Candidatus Bathyarchaeia archaeon]|nr:C39 family peptidase [Candidatus Bathyarchaeia archaeon]